MKNDQSQGRRKNNDFFFFFHLFIWGIFSFPLFTISDHLELVLALSWRDHASKALIYGIAEHIIEQ
jgi:hypothetical protein